MLVTIDKTDVKIKWIKSCERISVIVVLVEMQTSSSSNALSVMIKAPLPGNKVDC